MSQTLTKSDTEVVIDIAGKTWRLVPTLAAVRRLSSLYNGLIPVFQRLEGFDFSAVTHVIAAGSNTELSIEEFDALEEAVWRQGTNFIAGKAAMKYVNILLAGGKPVDPPSSDDSGEAAEGKP